MERLGAAGSGGRAVNAGKPGHAHEGACNFRETYGRWAGAGDCVEGGRMGVRVMVVDDHRLLAEALASALKLRGHRVLAAAAPAAGAADLVVARAPEVCLIGTATPAEPGIFDPVVRIRAEAPQVAVVVLGPVPSPRGIAAAFAAGACGYVRHDERIEGVERAIVRACKGEAVVAPQLLAGAFAELLNPAVQPDDEGQRLLALLTPREVEVLVRVAEGEDTRVIAAGMGIAPSTARTHVQRVLMKLGVGSRLEAAALAARTGLLDRAAPVVPGQRSASEVVAEGPRGRRSP